MRKQGFAPMLLIIVAAVLAIGGVGIGLAWKTDLLDKWLPASVKEFFGKETTPTNGEQPPTDGEEQQPTVEDPTRDWKTYVSAQYGYEIKYPPDNVEMILENYGYDFGAQVLGPVDDWSIFPVKITIAVEILENPKNLSLAWVGNERYATDAPEPYDLGWQETTFAGQPVLRAEYGPPGDFGYMTIYLLERGGTIYSVFKAIVDESYEYIADQMLATFRLR